jgi:hypothetical protein
MHCTPKKTVLKIEGCGGGYLIPVKKNQMGLYKEIERKSKEENPLSMSYSRISTFIEAISLKKILNHIVKIL